MKSGRGVLFKILYEEALPRGPTPYPFVYHFDRKGAPFIEPRLLARSVSRCPVDGHFLKKIVLLVQSAL